MESTVKTAKQLRVEKELHAILTESLDRAFAMCRNKNRGWDSKRRGLHDTLLQRATWHSIRDTYFAAPPTGLFPSDSSHGASVAPSATSPALAPALATQVVVYAPVRNLFVSSSLFYSPVPRSVAALLPPPQAT
jgi:hypothetical protein